MPTPVLTHVFDATDEFAFSSVSLLSVIETVGGTWLLAAGNATGAVSRIRLTEGRDMVLVGRDWHPDGGGDLAGGLSVDHGGRTYVLRLDAFGGAAHVQNMDLDGDPGARIAPGPIENLREASGGRIEASDMVASIHGNATHIVTVGPMGEGLTSYQLIGSSGGRVRLDHVDSEVATPKSGATGIDLIETVDVGAARFVVSSSIDGAALSSHALSATGNLSFVDTIAAWDGLWLSGLSDLASVEVSGQTFVIAAAWESSTLSTVRVNPMGVFFPADILHDTRDTRFGGASTVDTFEVNDRDFVVAGGTDGGISLLEVLPGGDLFHHHAIEQTVDWALGAVAALEVAILGHEAQIFVAGANADGLAQFALPLGEIGVRREGGSGRDTLNGTSQDDLLLGNGGNDVLRGGAGDDVLFAGTGTDRLSGGSGADVFVFEADGRRDVIVDFEIGVDRLDLGDWGYIYDVSALSISSTGSGALIEWRDESLDIRSANGARIEADAFQADDFLF